MYSGVMTDTLNNERASLLRCTERNSSFLFIS